MKITHSLLKAVRDDFLLALERNNIKEIVDFRQYWYLPAGKPGEGDIVHVDSRNKNLDSRSCFVDYYKIGAGVPIRLYINLELGFSIISVYTKESIPGYCMEKEESDKYGNTEQNRMIYSTSLADIVKELVDL